MKPVECHNFRSRREASNLALTPTSVHLRSEKGHHNEGRGCSAIPPVPTPRTQPYGRKANHRGIFRCGKGNLKSPASRRTRTALRHSRLRPWNYGRTHGFSTRHLKTHCQINEPEGATCCARLGHCCHRLEKPGPRQRAQVR